jgi:superfamily II DNA helicase RecQ
MAYRIFVVSARDEGAATAELNGFLRSHRVLAVDRRWVKQDGECYWSFCVDYLESGAGRSVPGGKNGDGAGRPRVDYREILSPEDFSVFARLRQVRKELAQADSSPVYTVFTNEQLAQMVRGRTTTRAALEKIAGVGEARIEKYGPRMLEILCQQWGGEGNGTDAAGKPPI